MDGQHWRPLAAPGETRRFCANAAHDVCNWLAPSDPGDTPGGLCAACRLNRVIPNLETPANRLRWQRLEIAKHRLVYGLLRLWLPLLGKLDDPRHGLAFDFLEGDPWEPETEPVMTRHAQGVITINIAEADDAERERQRTQMAESYRTLLGHFRHESGHYYWERMVHGGPAQEPFRATFGDERAPYDAALASHYGEGPPPDWRERFISAYAAAHPWEDWAETWAHYLHMVDTLETAHALQVETGFSPGGAPDAAIAGEPGEPPLGDPYENADFEAMLRAWWPLTYAVNSLNRSMGQADLYPFVLTPRVIAKLRFVHDLIRFGRAEAP